MALREEELTMLFEAVDAMIDSRISLLTMGENGVEYNNAEKLKQDCINMIAFGETIGT